MHTDQIYIARDGKSGMHVLVRILAVDDIGKDYLPIDPDDFNKLMMARDVRSLVLAARDLGPMHISADILSRRTFIPSHLQQDIECGFNLVPSDLESLLSECYFDPYAIPDEIAGMGYRAIGRTGKKATRELINELDFTKAGDLSYLDSQFRAIVEPLHDWVYAVKGAPTGETSWDNIDLTLREISEATVEKQEEALRKKRSLSSRCPSYKNSAPAGRQIKQTEDTGFETPTKPHGILGRIKGLFDKFWK